MVGNVLSWVTFAFAVCGLSRFLVLRAHRQLGACLAE